MAFFDQIKKTVSSFLSWPVNTEREIESQPSSGRSKSEFKTLLRQLELDPRKKRTIMDSIAVDKYTFSDEAVQSPNEIPEYIMHRLMIVDYGARAFTCKKGNRKSGRCEDRDIDTNKDDDDDKDSDEDSDDANDEDSDNDDDDDRDDIDKDEKATTTTVNPMDAFLALIHCSNDFLRQDLANKLCTCQLSVPFLLPNPDRPSEEITMLLWALECIKKSWKVTNDETGSFSDHQAFITRHPFPIVSFVRVGENDISKSRLLNEVMSDINGYHDFFFHRQCEGGGVTRKIVDGLVELCWYLPGGKEKQAFNREICFANLRGDAKIFRKQFALLSKISSVILVLVPSESLDDATKKFLNETTSDELGKVVFLFQKTRQPDTRRFFEGLKSSSNFFTIIKEKKENDHAFFKAIRSQILKGLNVSILSSPKIMLDFVDLANACGINVDKEKELWKTAYQCSTRAIECFEGSSQHAKKLFKLQSHVPKIANLEREKFRQTARRNRGVQDYSNQLHEMMKKERTLQEVSLNEVKVAVQTCLDVYSSMSDTQQNFFLTCLKHSMDNMSLEILPPLQQKYQDVCQIISENKEDKESKDCLKQLQTAIAESSFGLEHIVREMTQIFEVTETKKTDYAKIAAQMLLSGRPLELMDGDSLHVSLTWLRAVFDELKTLIGDINVFVISVLGIQSSGKSTMLNTMFGLQFAVSAGRCTRGAFASLIPLGDSLRRESKYEYLLIIDTEGLRGSAETQMREHDNELATFAIGVADLTIVNIFGENHNDIQEFLQIAVHAFLKMKLVEEKRMCQIIHQNVAATNASNQLVSDRMALKNVLDEMTQLAAIEEKCERECQGFNDVIVFDQNNDVSYIPSMLQGCPPMAPVSPEYGKSIHKVKEKIIALISSPERVPVSISQFQERVKILWNAILREDFIFSFRNTKEVRAKTSLDQKFFKESVKTITSEMTMLEMDITSALKNCRPEHRRELWQLKKSKIAANAEALAMRMKEEMVGFFDTNEDKATLEQWRVNTMNKIENLKRIRATEVENNCKTIYDHLQNRQEIDTKKLVYKKELLEKAKKCIAGVEEGARESVYEQTFEDLWDEWIEDIPRSTVERVNVHQAMETVLITGNEKLSGIIMRKYYEKNCNLNEFGRHFPIVEIGMFQFGWWEKLKKKMPLANPQRVLEDAIVIIDKAVDVALSFAKETKLRGARCREADLQSMYHNITKIFHEETKGTSFKFRDTLTCDILLHSFGKALPLFEDMEENYTRENDLKLYLEETLKPDLKSYFMDQCMKIKSEISAASSFAEALKRPIQSKLNQSMGAVVATELLNISYFQSKGQFHAKVLLEMGEMAQFDGYTSYLTNPVKFLKEKLQTSIEFHCKARSISAIAQLYEIEVKKIKSTVFLAIQSAGVKPTTSDEDSGISEWIDRFILECATLAVAEDMFDIVTIHGDLKDFQFFQEEVEKMLTTYFESIIDHGVFSLAMSEWQPNPYDVLVDAMFGCDKCCPFCKALCDQTVKDHAGSHSCKNHRPQGIVGYRWLNSNILITDICTFLVAGERSFKNPDTSWEFRPYKQYQTVNDYYKSWSIAPDTSFEASAYWKWFMAKYPGELAAHHTVKPPEIPSNWKSITFKEAKESIQAQYHI